MLKTVAASLAMALLLAGSAAAQDKPEKKAPAKPVDAAPGAPSGEDRYVGYYYPKPTSNEIFPSPMETIAGVDRPQRVQFVTVISQGTLQSAYRVPYAVFVKGEKADKLIVVGTQAGELNTVFRQRALLANMTTMARLSPFFQQHTVAEDATFFDLLKLLGFASVTVSDGEKVTHQVFISSAGSAALARPGEQRIHSAGADGWHCARVLQHPNLRTARRASLRCSATPRARAAIVTDRRSSRCDTSQRLRTYRRSGPCWHRCGNWPGWSNRPRNPRPAQPG